MSPGSEILGGAGACVYAAASGKLVGVAGSGGWRGDCVVVGVLRRLASWLPGLGGGIGAMVAYIVSD